MRAIVGAVFLCVGCEPWGAPIDAGAAEDGGTADAGVDPFDAGCTASAVEPVEPCGGAPASCADLEAEAADAIEQALVGARSGCTSPDDCTLLGDVRVHCPFEPTFVEVWCPVAVLKTSTCEFTAALEAASQEVCDRCREQACDSTPNCPPTTVVCREGVCVAEVP